MINRDDLKIIQDYLAINDKPKKSDLIFLFGQIRMPEAWNKAAELYKSGYASKILITGGLGPTTVKIDLKLSEAETICNYLVKIGIPENDMIIEVNALNTVENVVFGINKVREQGIVAERIISVSKPFHARRCLATFNKYFPEIEILCCPPTGDIKDLMDRPKKEYFQVVLDEFRKLETYANRGDITNQNIPRNIKEIIKINI